MIDTKTAFTERQKDTTLGLTVSRGIIEDHGRRNTLQIHITHNELMELQESYKTRLRTVSIVAHPSFSMSIGTKK
jgi:hypothetical protein